MVLHGVELQKFWDMAMIKHGSICYVSAVGRWVNARVSIVLIISHYGAMRATWTPDETQTGRVGKVSALISVTTWLHEMKSNDSNLFWMLEPSR